MNNKSVAPFSDEMWILVKATQENLKELSASQKKTAQEAAKEIKELRAIPVKVKDQVLWTRTEIKGNAFKLFKAISLGILGCLLKICQ